MADIAKSVLFIVTINIFTGICLWSGHYLGAIWRQKYISYISKEYFTHIAEYSNAPETYEIICDETRQLFGIICGSPMPLLEGIVFGPRGLLFQVF